MADYIIVVMDAGLFSELGLDLLLESKWKPSGVKDYWHRVEQPRAGSMDLRHVHVAHQRHIHAKGKQVSWNIDGARHDKSSFHTGFSGMRTAREIAARVLGAGPDVTFENYQGDRSEVLAESLLRDEKSSVEALIDAMVLVAHRAS